MVTKLRASYALFVRFQVIAPDIRQFHIQWYVTMIYMHNYFEISAIIIIDVSRPLPPHHSRYSDIPPSGLAGFIRPGPGHGAWEVPHPNHPPPPPPPKKKKLHQLPSPQNETDFGLNCHCFHYLNVASVCGPPRSPFMLLYRSCNQLAHLPNYLQDKIPHFAGFFSFLQDTTGLFKIIGPIHLKLMITPRFTHYKVYQNARHIYFAGL